MLCYTTDQNENLTEKEIKFAPCSGGEMKQVRVYPETTFQNVLGMGGALTEAAAYTWLQMGEKNRDKLLNLYFGKEGNNYNFCRCHIQSCDFALGNYAYVEDPADENLSTFQIDRDRKYILPLIKAATGNNEQIEFLASPWSPPAFMKTNEEMNHGGKLKKEYYAKWAKMIALYVKAYEAEGIKISRLTVQNEPKASQTWDSCLYTAEEEQEFAVEYLSKALAEAGRSDVKINVWDHNKELVLERARECLSTDAAKEKIGGVAFHWYSGDHFEQLAQVRSEFPDKELIFTEGCVEYSRYKDETGGMKYAEMYAHEIIGNFNAGSNAFIDWNIYLNKQGGPNHVGNFCDAPVMCDVENDEVKINKSFYYIGHFSRFIQKGARRMLCSRYTDKIELCGFINPDNSKVLVVMNKNDSDEDFSLYCQGKGTDIKIKAHSIITLCWN